MFEGARSGKTTLALQPLRKLPPSTSNFQLLTVNSRQLLSIQHFQDVLPMPLLSCSQSALGKLSAPLSAITRLKATRHEHLQDVPAELSHNEHLQETGGGGLVWNSHFHLPASPSKPRKSAIFGVSSGRISWANCASPLSNS